MSRSFHLLLSLILLIIGGLNYCEGYLSFLPKRTNNSFKSGVLFGSHPEYSVVQDEDDDDDDEVTSAGSGDYFSVNVNDFVSSPKDDDGNSGDVRKTIRAEYGALSPGTVVQVQIGDLSLARKAWKKRRRTGSPLLVPCSILNVDRQSMVRWNLIYLLEKFGKNKADGIEISESELSTRYRTFLRSSLQKQAMALGFDSSYDMILSLFDKKVQESYGVRLVEREDGQKLSLKAPISRRKAHQRVAGTPLLQFRLHRDGDHGDEHTLAHTGYIRTRKDDNSEQQRSYYFLPLSAALRVSQKDDVDTGRVEDGSIHAAVVFDFDAAGDGGSPLLTLSLNPRGVRETLKVKPDRKYTPIEDPKLMLNELSVGDGPFRGKVVRLPPGRALVDLEVGRKVSAEGMVKVLGTLHFQDSVDIVGGTRSGGGDLMSSGDDGSADDLIESAIDDWDDEDWEDGEYDEDYLGGNDGFVEDLLSLRDESSFEDGSFEDYDDDAEEEEDISSLFAMNDDGSLTYTDPETGETILLDTDDEDYEDMMMVKKQIDMHSHISMNNDVPKQAKGISKEKFSETKQIETSLPTVITPESLASKPSFKSKRLKVGDDVEVYIRTVSKQSKQFTVTTNPFVKGRKALDLKKETDAQKKLKRLEKSLGGSLRRIWELEGQECNGTVKATSKTGGWAYVQPDLIGLPVGVAIMNEDTLGISAGDTVRVRIAGVDEQRGQLAMQVLSKLEP